MTDINWMEALPFQHEVIHSSVLRFLLSQEPKGGDNSAVSFIRQLSGDKRPKSVETPRLEVSLRPRRRLDLVAGLKRSDGTESKLAVEMKVDSAWDWTQLVESAPSDATGLLIAVGLTHLTIRQEELDLMKAEFPDSAGWAVVGPGRLAEAISTCFQPRAGSELEQYVLSLQAEANDHDAAVAHFQSLRPRDSQSSGFTRTNPARDGTGDAEALLMTAYLANCLDRFDSGRDPQWRWSHPQSGPAVIRALEVESDKENPGWLSWMEINGSFNSPKLNIKVGRSGAGIGQDRARVVEAISKTGLIQGTANERKLGDSSKTATAWTIPVADNTPSELAELVGTLVTALGD